MSNDFVRRAPAPRPAAFVLLLGVLLLAAACGGGDAANTAAKASGGSVSSEDVETDLKFDARVSDFEADGNKLVVNVNEHWMSSPAGMQQTAVKRWLSRWQASKADDGGKPPKDAQVVVRYDGGDILTATADGGVKVVAKAKTEDEGGDAK